MIAETETKTLPKPSTTSGGGTKDLLRHYVKLTLEGKPADECLCGHIWDRVNISNNGDICQECVEISKTIKPGDYHNA